VACISHPKDVINFSAFAFGRHGRPGPKKDTGQIGGSCLDEFAPRFEMPSGYFPLALPCLAGQISAENGKGHLEGPARNTGPHVSFVLACQGSKVALTYFMA